MEKRVTPTSRHCLPVPSVRPRSLIKPPGGHTDFYATVCPPGPSKGAAAPSGDRAQPPLLPVHDVVVRPRSQSHRRRLSDRGRIQTGHEKTKPPAPPLVRSPNHWAAASRAISQKKALLQPRHGSHRPGGSRRLAARRLAARRLARSLQALVVAVVPCPCRQHRHLQRCICRFHQRRLHRFLAGCSLSPMPGLQPRLSKVARDHAGCSLSPMPGLQPRLSEVARDAHAGCSLC